MSTFIGSKRGILAFTLGCHGVVFWATICKMVCPMLSDYCPVCPVSDVGVLLPNSWMDQDETWHAGRPRPRPYCVRWGASSPIEMGTAAHHFRNLQVQALPASI